MSTKNQRELNLFIHFCGWFCLSIMLIVPFISYYICGIVYLVKDYKIECGYLWEYSLTSLICSLTMIGVYNKIDDGDIFGMTFLLISSLMDMGLAIWGGFELQNRCYQYDLYYFGVFSMILQIMTPLAIVIVGVCLCYHAETPTRSVTTIQNSVIRV